MQSIWRKETPEIKAGQCTTNHLHFDTIVVGGGMAGILIAYHLQQEGQKVLVLEANKIASGQTEGTTAKITSQHGIKYSKLISNIGTKQAQLYATANEDAINEYERLIAEKNIDCDFKRLPSYLYTCEDTASLERELNAALDCGITAQFHKETELPFKISGAVSFPNQAQFSPLKFLKAISSGLTILEDTRVYSIRDNSVISQKGRFSADSIVIATHYPIFNVPGFYFLRQHQERSSIVALSGCEPISAMYYGIDKNALSFRQAGDYLLIGGGSHRTGKTGGVYEFLSHKAEQLYPDAVPVTFWSAQDCMPHDGIPFIGRYSSFHPDVYVATGFQKWGMSTSMIAAKIIRDKICGYHSPYAPLFSPKRFHLKASLPGLIKDMTTSTHGIVKGLLHFPTDSPVFMAKDSAKIVSAGNRRYACYKDKEGMLHKISPRCPHLGCELEWNEDDHSWDCPCHGSRFDIDGKIINNPAKYDNNP